MQFGTSTVVLGRSFSGSRAGKRMVSTGLGVLLLLATLASAGNSKSKESGQTVDEGSFGVFMGGKRVATETFSIHQDTAGSSVKSEFKTDAGAGIGEATQSSELQLGSGGELKKYEWKESSPGQSQATIAPNQDFLIEKYTSTPLEKTHEQPFMLPTSTSILDDYFFIQREVLAWKYLATSCKQDKGQLSCPLKQSIQLGTINAHSRASSPVSVEYSGREKVPIRGVERELIRLDMKSDVGDWTLWLDDHLKLQRILDLASNTEVVRD
ncbi:MAG: hypothetical protein WB952_17845 [Terriglobales bacterium]